MAQPAKKKRLEDLTQFDDITVEDGYIHYAKDGTDYKFPLAKLREVVEKVADRAAEYAFGTVFRSSSITATDTAVLDCTTASEFYVTLTQPTCALSIINPLTDDNIVQQISLTLIQGTGSNFVTWPANVKFENDWEPKPSYQKDKEDLFVLTTRDKGVTWKVMVAAQGY